MKNNNIHFLNIKKYVICSFLALSLTFNMVNAGGPATGGSSEPTQILNLGKLTFSEVSALATKYSAAITAASSSADWAKKLTDFATKKIAKKLAVDLVNKMSSCIEGNQSSCKSPLYLKDPGQFMANIASSEINRVASKITADVNLVSNQFLYAVQKDLMNNQIDINKRIVKAMSVLNEYESSKAAIVCSQNYIDRVRVIEGGDRANKITNICNTVKVSGSYVSADSVNKINAIISTSKTPFKNDNAYFAVFNNPGLKGSNVSNDISSAISKNTETRQNSESQAIAASGGYRSARKCIEPVGATEDKCTKWEVLTPSGTIRDQDTYARLQPARSWENVNTVEDFISVSGDQLTTALVNRASKETAKAVNDIKISVSGAITNAVKDLAGSINNGVNSVNKELQCAVNDKACQEQKKIQDLSSASYDNDIKYVKTILSQNISGAQNDLASFKKVITSKTYYQDKLNNGINVLSPKISKLEEIINYYDKSQEVSNYLKQYPNIKNDLLTRFNEIVYKRDNLKTTLNNYESNLDLVSKDIKEMSSIEAELIALAGDRENYPNLYNLSIYNQCLSNIENGKIKTLLDLKNVYIEHKDKKYITDNIDKYKNVLMPDRYACDVPHPSNKDFEVIKALVTREDVLHTKRYRYEMAMKDPDSASKVSQTGEVIEEEVKAYHNINESIKNINEYEAINQNPKDYIVFLIEKYYPAP